MNAILKYPVAASSGRPKYGAYDPEADGFAWARDQCPVPDGTPTLEARLMDWSNDIAYAVHDVEDFYRAGLIPLTELRTRDERRVLD